MSNKRFRITRVESFRAPDDSLLKQRFLEFGLPDEEIIKALEGFTCPTIFSPGKGYQQYLSKDLEEHLSSILPRGNIKVIYDRSVSPGINEQADLVLRNNGSDNRLLIEIEFRPNVEKDLVKFQIAANRGVLVGAVLILASRRNSINPQYPTMPEFNKFVRIIRELKPSYPLLLLGIGGEYVLDNGAS